MQESTPAAERFKRDASLLNGLALADAQREPRKRQTPPELVLQEALQEKHAFLRRGHGEPFF